MRFEDSQFEKDYLDSHKLIRNLALTAFSSGITSQAFGYAMFKATIDLFQHGFGEIIGLEKMEEALHEYKNSIKDNADER